MRRVLAAALVALGILASAVASAESAERDYIVLLLPEHETPVARRLRAEVSKLDVDVHVAQLEEPVDPDEPRMAELAKLFGGEAVVLLAQDGRSATIWFSRAEAGEKLKRVVQAPVGSPDLSSESVVVGTMELLRVRLLTRRSEPPPAETPIAPPPPPPPPPPPTPPPAPERRFLVIGAVVGLDKPGNRFSFGSSYQFNVDVGFSPLLAARAFIRLPAASSQAKLGTATAEVQSVIVAAGLALGTDVAKRLRVDVFAGGGGAHVVAQGFSEVPATTSQRSRWVLAGAANLRGALEIAPILSATAQTGLVLSSIPVEVVVNDQTAAVWGRPAWFFGMGLELRPDLR